MSRYDKHFRYKNICFTAIDKRGIFFVVAISHNVLKIKTYFRNLNEFFKC